MTAAHISPNVFSLQLSLASIYSLSYYNIPKRMHTYYTSHSQGLYCITLYYLIHPCPSSIFTSSVLPGRLAALSSLRRIHVFTFKIKQAKEFHFYHYLHSLQVLTISVKKRVHCFKWINYKFLLYTESMMS
jgi:hypothetical protein